MYIIPVCTGNLVYITLLQPWADASVWGLATRFWRAMLTVTTTIVVWLYLFNEGKLTAARRLSSTLDDRSDPVLCTAMSGLGLLVHKSLHHVPMRADTSEWAAQPHPPSCCSHSSYCQDATARMLLPRCYCQDTDRMPPVRHVCTARPPAVATAPASRSLSPSVSLQHRRPA